MGRNAVDGNRPTCCIVDELLLTRLFRTRFSFVCLGNSVWFRLFYGSLSSMWTGLVVQDSCVCYIPLVDPVWWPGRDGFIRLSPMPFGYWYWIKVSRMPNELSFLSRSLA